MASSLLTSTLAPPTSSTFPLCPQSQSPFSSLASPEKSKSDARFERSSSDWAKRFSFNALYGYFFKEGFGSEDEPSSPTISGLTALEDQEDPLCPPGLRKYEGRIVLRPDVSDDERLFLTEKYEEIMHYYTLHCLVILKTVASNS